MIQTDSATPSLGYLFGVLFRHKKKALLTFLGFCGLAVFIALFFPRTYRSEAKLYVRVGRESITLDPTATTGQTVMMQKSQEAEINSVLDILGSRQIKKAVVEKLGTDQILESDRPQNIVLTAIDSARSALSAILDSFSPPVEGGDADESIPSADEELAVRRLQSRTSARAAKNSNVITIACKAGTPKLAQSIAQSMLDAFISEHLRLNRTEGSFDFFVDQTKRQQVQLKDKQAQLQNTKSKYQLLSVEGKRALLEEKLRDIELASVHADRLLAFARAKIQDLERALENVDRLVTTEAESGFSDLAHAAMREQLYDLEIREGELRQTYVDTHPMVVAIREQRKEMAKILQQRPELRTQTTSALNPTWQALELDLERQRNDVLALEAQRNVLDQQLADAQHELEQLNKREVEIAALQREMDLIEANYHIHTEKLEQARIDAELGSQDISSVNVVQPASYVRKAVSPKKSMVLPAGLMLGILGAFGIALTAEYLDQSLRTPEQTEAHLGIPVVMTISKASRYKRGLSMKGARHASS